MKNSIKKFTKTTKILTKKDAKKIKGGITNTDIDTV